MIVVMRHQGGADVESLLVEAAGVLASRPGCLRVDVGRSPDDPLQWQLLSEWADAGSMRHGLGSFEAKVALGGLQGSAVAGGGVFEVLQRFEGGSRIQRTTDRAEDADQAGPLR